MQLILSSYKNKKLYEESITFYCLTIMLILIIIVFDYNSNISVKREGECIAFCSEIKRVI